MFKYISLALLIISSYITLLIYVGYIQYPVMYTREYDIGFNMTSIDFTYHTHNEIWVTLILTMILYTLALMILGCLILIYRNDLCVYIAALSILLVVPIFNELLYSGYENAYLDGRSDKVYNNPYPSKWYYKNHIIGAIIDGLMSFITICFVANIYIILKEYQFTYFKVYQSLIIEEKSESNVPLITNPLREKMDLYEISDDDLPDWAICPITHDIMYEPVMDEFGHNYEKSDLEKWKQRNNSSPLNRNDYVTNELKPNKELEKQINEWLDIKMIKDDTVPYSENEEDYRISLTISSS